jgi:hypothetical protein
MNICLQNGLSMIRILQKDVWRDRINWKDQLAEKLHHYDIPKIITISEGNAYDVYAGKIQKPSSVSVPSVSVPSVSVPSVSVPSVSVPSVSVPSVSVPSVSVPSVSVPSVSVPSVSVPSVSVPSVSVPSASTHIRPRPNIKLVIIHQ